MTAERTLLLVESEFDSEVYITESEGSKKLYVEGVFLQSNKPNRNNRIYPLSALSKHVDEYKKDYITPGRALGELDHPATPTTNLERVSHIVEDIYQNGDSFIGKARILNTPMGNIAKNLLNEGVKLGVSSRGVGSLSKRGGVDYVSDNYKLLAIDLVCTPSAQEAIVEAIYENKDYMLDYYGSEDKFSSARKLIINQGLNNIKLQRIIRKII